MVSYIWLKMHKHCQRRNLQAADPVVGNASPPEINCSPRAPFLHQNRGICTYKTKCAPLSLPPDGGVIVALSPSGSQGLPDSGRLRGGFRWCLRTPLVSGGRHGEGEMERVTQVPLAPLRCNWVAPPAASLRPRTPCSPLPWAGTQCFLPPRPREPPQQLCAARPPPAPQAAT